jgi:hypothetical protein
MKNICLTILICYLIANSICYKITINRSTTTSSKSKQYDPSYISALNFKPLTTFGAKDITINNPTSNLSNYEAWLCATDGKVYRHSPKINKDGGHEIIGKFAKKCKNLTIDSKGNVFVVTTDGGLHMFRKIMKGITATWISFKTTDVEDITTGYNDEIFYVSKKGRVKRVLSYVQNTAPVVEQFNKKLFGKECKIAYSSDTEQAVIVDKDGNIFEVSKKKVDQKFKDVIATDVCINSQFNIFIATSGGILLYKPRFMKNSYGIVERGIAKRISCSRTAWIVGLDNTVYSSSNIYDTN